MNATTKQMLIGGAVLGGIVAVWSLYEKIKGALDSFGKGAADLVPQGVYDAIAGERAQVTAGVVLPGGQSLSFNKIVEQGGSLQHLGGERYEFTYNGTKYRVVPPRRSDGYYVAVKA